VLGDLPVEKDDRVLVDYRTGDDAGVYKLGDDRALVQTVDFFTPIVDDPYVYGRIAAANALSDIYAMGGRPLTALAVAAFPTEIDPRIIKAIFSGGVEALRAAGVVLLGGHTVQDSEIKFGYSITGEVQPDQMWTNAGARPGDDLLLTKRIGTGIVATAIKFDRAPEAMVDAAVKSMTTVNGGAAAALQSLGARSVHACTDITGFGLLGHGSAMAAASGVTLEIDAVAVPLLDGVLAIAAQNIPGGGRSNARHFAGGVRMGGDVSADLALLLHDPQTSGGLLVSIDGRSTKAALDRLAKDGCDAWPIGRVLTDHGCRVIVK
jgi:selenide,water dikinase